MILVQTSDGELRFKSLADVRRALAVGLISPDDRIRLDAGEWQPMSDLVPRTRGFWKPHFHWYVLGVAVLVAVAIGGGLAALGVVGAHVMWRMSLRRERVRWW